VILRNFIVFEGCDGAGTTTQAELLQKRFLAEGRPCFRTAEPTGGPVGKFLRRILQNEFEIAASATAYLFAADRCEHIYGKGGILERLKNGETVLCDRYVLSSLVYQGLLCGRELPALLNRDFPAPELLFFFDIDSEIAFKRVQDRAQQEKKQQEIYEEAAFQRKVRLMYKKNLAFCREQGTKVKVIDASLPVNEVADAVRAEYLSAKADAGAA